MCRWVSPAGHSAQFLSPAIKTGTASTRQRLWPAGLHPRQNSTSLQPLQNQVQSLSLEFRVEHKWLTKLSMYGRLLTRACAPLREAPELTVERYLRLANVSGYHSTETSRNSSDLQQASCTPLQQANKYHTQQIAGNILASKLHCHLEGRVLIVAWDTRDVSSKQLGKNSS